MSIELTNTEIFMYQLDSERLENIIQRAYTDSGSLNDLLVQTYLAQLKEGALRKIEPSLLIDLLFQSISSDKEEIQPSYIAFDDTTGKVGFLSNDDGTSTAVINQKNEIDKQEFDKQSYKFLYLLRHTVFEDGMENEATSFFRKMQERNKYVAICWLQEFWSDHQEEPSVVEGIVRIIGSITDKAYWKPLISIVRSGLTDKSKPVQEAAIMVVESWRTLACYQALKQTQFEDGWIKDYAKEVMIELEDELKDEIHKKN